MYGSTGNILHVDLSTSKIWVEHPDKSFFRKYLGGRAIGLYCILKNMRLGADLLSPDNILIFAASVIAGTSASCFPRYTICTKSPLTGAEGKSEAGGWV